MRSSSIERVYLNRGDDMSKFFITTAAILIAGTAAHAQDAFITQLGSNNQGINYSEYTQGPSTSDNLQVIAQEGDNLRAGNFTRGSNSTAMAYQLNSGNASGSSMESLIFQNGGSNTAIAVQDNSPTFGNNNRTYVSQIIQEGATNTAINWNQTASGQMANLSIGTISAPSINIAPAATPLPGPNATYTATITVTSASVSP